MKRNALYLIVRFADSATSTREIVGAMAQGQETTIHWVFDTDHQKSVRTPKECQRPIPLQNVTGFAITGLDGVSDRMRLGRIFIDHSEQQTVNHDLDLLVATALQPC